MKYKIKFAILSLILISIFAIIYLQSSSKGDLKNVALEIKSSEISNDSRTNICDVILIPSVEFKDLGVISNGIIQLFNDSTAIVIPRGFRTYAKPWLNDTRLINDNLYYMLQIYESFDLNLKNNITKNIIYTFSSKIKAYSLAIVNSLERKLSDGEVRLPNEIT